VGIAVRTELHDVAGDDGPALKHGAPTASTTRYFENPYFFPAFSISFFMSAGCPE
jgi:hypothetical protein